MKRVAKQSKGDMRAEYDFQSMKGGVRGKYVERLARSANIVLLEDDVAAAFPDDRAVNEALRALMKLVAKVRRAKRHVEEPLGKPR